MNESELHFFEAVKLFNEELYWDAIELFQNSLSEGLEDRYVDDCFLNIAICYMQLKLFNEAEEFFLKAISSADQSGDKIDFEGPIYGKTSDRAKLGLIRISLIQKNLQKAEDLLSELKESDSYIEVDGSKISMYQAAESEIEKAKSSFL
tara:strand:- start:600 stop:1046 length:447 start_codon:yes stop_codon:yes gene_type:complete